MDTIMENELNLDNVTTGFGIASVVVIIFNTVLTIAKELYPPLLVFMKSISILGIKHHWLVHGITITVLFCILGWIFSKTESLTTIRSKYFTKAIVWATILSSLGIIVFFLIELFN